MNRLFLFFIPLMFLAHGFAYAKKAQTAKKGPNSMSKAEIAYLAGGCFWGMEELLRKIPGVTDVEVGYMGGSLKNATYNLVKTGSTGHAESVKISFDSNKITYSEILLHFFLMHDPTTKNRQGNDVGTQYRSAIFFLDKTQQEEAERIKLRVEKSGAWKAPVVTEIVPATEFWKAEDFHQDYLQKNPTGYTCHYIRNIDF